MYFLLDKRVNSSLAYIYLAGLWFKKSALVIELVSE